MNLFEAVILGIVQGLTEFLPISSSAHVQIVQQLIGQSSMSKPALTAFIATIQLGTELAVLIYFWKDIVRIAKAFFVSIFGGKRSADSKLGWLIIFGSVPVVVIGLAFKDLIENQLRNLWVVSLTLIVFGVVLALADRFGLKLGFLGLIGGAAHQARIGILAGFKHLPDRIGADGRKLARPRQTFALSRAVLGLCCKVGRRRAIVIREKNLVHMNHLSSRSARPKPAPKGRALIRIKQIAFTEYKPGRLGNAPVYDRLTPSG